LPTGEGVLVAEVQQNSPAGLADVRKGDIIESLDGKRITDPMQISSSIQKKNVKDKVAVRINRYGRQFDREIELLSRPTGFGK
jgi:serine protease Do